MRKLFTLMLGVLFITVAVAQRPEAVIMPAGETVPVIDGVLDDNGAWGDANVYNIALKANEEEFTFGAEGETTWRALWNQDGIYIFISTVDDAWYPSYISGSANSWEYDKPEIYIDVNYLLEDGKGPVTAGSGHYQVAPAAEAAKVNGTPTTESTGVIYAYMVDAPNWDIEYFVPFSMLVTSDGGAYDKTGEMGFDITMIDRDPNDSGARRATWSNPSDVDGSWNNMDDCGYVTLSGAEAPVYVEEITLTVNGAITEDAQTLQVMAEVLPEDADVKVVKWVLTSRSGAVARASISKNGVITPVIDEELTIQAISSDGFIYSNEVDVSISGQKPTLERLNYIKDGNFDNVTASGAPGSDWTTSPNAIVSDGVLVFGPEEPMANMWDYKLLQTTHVPYELKDLDYIITFKAWADEPRQMPLVIEDAYNGSWAAFGTSPDGNFSDKVWYVELTTTPTIYTLHANFGIMTETCVQNFNFQIGTSAVKIYVDSIYMVSVADMALIPTVYPNPASSKLHVELSTANTTVAIYNSVGIKMDEVVVQGNHHMFDVSRYTKGLYFVKANNTVIKFVK